jgi:hypothetical protein
MRMGGDARPLPTGPDGDAEGDLYARSWLAVRTIVGVAGASLPLALVVGEALLDDRSTPVRDSISAYYHSSMRDWLVAALCVVGVLLLAYRSAEKESREFRWSLVVGIAVIGVAFVPTERPGLGPVAAALVVGDGRTPCVGLLPASDGRLLNVQYALTEPVAGLVHFLCAGLFIVSLAFLAREFARQEQENGRPRLARFQRGCAWAIVLAIGWVVLGAVVSTFTATSLDLGPITPLYAGEVLAVLAFGASWLAAGEAVRRAWRKSIGTADLADPAGSADPADSADSGDPRPLASVSVSVRS